MSTYSKDRIKAMIAKDAEDLFNCCEEVKKSIRDSVDDILDYLQDLITQIPQSRSGPLIAKTPKLVKRKGVQRIETIPEDSVLDTTEIVLLSSVNKDVKLKNESNLEETIGTRTKRKASKTAADNIRKQQSMSLTSKLRKPENLQQNDNTNKILSDNRIKRTKSSRSSDEDEDKRPAKHTKIEEHKTRNNSLKDVNEANINTQISAAEDNAVKVEENCISALKHHRSSERKISRDIQKENGGKDDIIDEILSVPVTDDIDEPSMYEDALPKHLPIMNSTMKVSSTLLDKMMNVTVVLEPLSRQIILNETVTIKKSSVNSISNELNNKQHIEQNNTITNDKNKLSSCYSSETKKTSKNQAKDRVQQFKDAMANKEFDELITDDESSPEINRVRGKVQNLKVDVNTKKQKKIIQSPSTSDDEVLNTPMRPVIKENSALKELRSTYKSNVLFSPYAKESVKKRVEAFEQVCMSSPRLIDEDAPMRITRTKTRAMAAAEADKTVAQKLARKSLARAKKISLAKQVKDEEFKENKLNIGTNMGTNKLLQNEKINPKQRQKVTPLSKPKIQLPMSLNRNPKTPINNQLLPNSIKAFTASRANIVTSVESLIPMPRTASKQNSIDKIEETKRKQINDENARRKRDEALRLQTEEKRRKRQEKELKNRLAREAKEKQELEKRQRAEREKEEKARLAQHMQEKQREEMERKRLAQLQRAQEKEEKRKQEEQLRLKRLLEQEEAERLLAEQRRREQEADKRREAEARAQQQAAIEAMRLKAQMLTGQAKNKQMASNKNQGPVNYILDSEPDDDDSDDESKPKHVIPYWAQPHIRKAQLAMQRYIPDIAVYKFFDTRKCTPDLTELFIGIDRNRLKRTSSAIWKTPPRYSMMETE
ncbi:inner centromere protein A [Vespa velutina]|uniref:inner centromere protein A n=1 Tax=Vespa velutina TaxID=202808 RepID=UPI001FB31044|nr:inner centromere protein A [Vespa velutina]XP_047346747.1 inner centromere protein A [Vespa velutina]